MERGRKIDLYDFIDWLKDLCPDCPDTPEKPRSLILTPRSWGYEMERTNKNYSPTHSFIDDEESVRMKLKRDEKSER